MTHPDHLRAVRDAIEGALDQPDSPEAYDAMMERLLRAKEALPALESLVSGGWQPIETAPETGVTILLFQPWKTGFNQIMMGHYANGWVWQAACSDCGLHDINPTHWQPLPLPPGAVPVTPASDVTRKGV